MTVGAVTVAPVVGGPVVGGPVRARGGTSRVATVSAGIGTRPGSSPPTEVARVVLDVVDRIPAGRVLSYADVAELAGRSSARGVGQVMAKHGHEVSWWRVVQASGAPTRSAPDEALRQLRAEGTPLRGERVDMPAARWDGR